MLENKEESNPVNPAPLADWGFAYVLGVCERCDWSYLAPTGHLPQYCPHCFTGRLEELDPARAEPLAEFVRPPELYLPFTLQSGQLAQQIQQFASGLPFAPEDLTPAQLQKRLQRIFLPMWLVDSQVVANWQAEAGFNYQVKSHQESYGDGAGWRTREVTETRQRWESRVGTLERTYQNILAPALEAHALLMRSLGNFDSQKAQAFSGSEAFQTGQDITPLVRLPDRSTQDAWPDALPRFLSQATDECRQACAADHFREFRWSPVFRNQNWTLLLFPVLTTFYLDDENQPQQILIHGQSGTLHGARKASMRRARGVSLTILMVALLFFVLSLCVGAISAFNPVVLPFAGIGVLVALLIALGAIYPVAVVWSINRKHG